LLCSAIFAVVKGYGKRYGITSPATVLNPGLDEAGCSQIISSFVDNHFFPELYRFSNRYKELRTSADKDEGMATHWLVLQDEEGNKEQQLENDKLLTKFAALHAQNPSIFHTYCFNTSGGYLRHIGLQFIPPPASVIVEATEVAIKIFWRENFDFNGMQAYESSYVISPKKAMEDDLAHREKNPNPERFKDIQRYQSEGARIEKGLPEPVPEIKEKLTVDQLETFYAKYDPPKVEKAALILKQYSTSQLVQSLTKKYGYSPLPNTDASIPDEYASEQYDEDDSNDTDEL
jgi:hypothetical protein